MQLERILPAAQNTLVFWGSSLLGIFVFMLMAGCQPIDKQQASENVIRNLSYNFFLKEAIELSRSYDDRKKAQRYFVKRKGFGYSGSEQQGAMIVDGYMPQELKYIIGL